MKELLNSSSIAYLSLFLLPFHCAVMCGPSYLVKSRSDKELYLLGRFLSYSSVGGLFGYFGQSLYSFLEYEVLKFLSFFIFLCISILIFLSWLGVTFRLFPKSVESYQKQSKRLPTFFQGFLSVGLPCSIIYQMAGFSILTKNFYGGLLIGSVYSFVTGLFLWMGSGLGVVLQNRMKNFKLVFRMLMASLILLSMLHFFVKAWKPFSENELTPFQKEILCL